LIVTPTQTHVFRDDFRHIGPDSIRVTHTVPTDVLLGRAVEKGTNGAALHDQLEHWVADWLTRLTTSYEEALHQDPDLAKALFPDVVGAVADGRVVVEASL